MSFTLSIEVSTRGTYRIQLPTKAARTICKDWLDPEESWEAQAEDTLRTALEDELEESLKDALYDSMPTTLQKEIDGVKFSLKLEGGEPSVEVEDLEVGQ
mgnify:CR=1 FL=1